VEKKTSRRFQPETVMMSHGYVSKRSEYSVKRPLFLTSTFAFGSAQEGKRAFEIISGRSKLEPDEETDLIYSRFNNPDIEFLEDCLAYWEEAEACATFASGMAAISSTLLEFLKPGDIVLHSDPLYGGTDGFLKKVLSKNGIRSHGLSAKPDLIEQKIRESISLLYAGDEIGRLKMIFLETPANPTNDLFDIELFVELAKQYTSHAYNADGILIVVDNTFLGPVYQSPLKHGADLVIYSVTKYIGGHSDIVAGACLGSEEHIKRVKSMRSGSLGNMIDPFTAWLALRSLETLKIRMERHVANAERIVKFLIGHNKVARVYYPGLLRENDFQFPIYNKQCSSPGAMISFDIMGGEAEAFRFLDALELVKLAVSLGGTESLAEHPASMTHSGVELSRRLGMGITDSMIRLSVGIEDPDDLIYDLGQAFDKI
jgi:methionine-gamma-lyase